MEDHRGYQRGFSARMPSMYETAGRRRKAETMLRVLREVHGGPLDSYRVLTVGSSTGIIDERIAEEAGLVLGVDIDRTALAFAAQTFVRPNLYFTAADAMALPVATECFDVVICAQVYEHVPDAARMLAEIRRVLKPGGVCYFAANNRLMWMEPHYRLPLLSVIPRPLAHLYLRMAGRGAHYYERHYGYWALKRLVRGFRRVDYTRRMVEEPARYAVDYLVPTGGARAALARMVARRMPWLAPGYVWILVKPGLT